MKLLTALACVLIPILIEAAEQPRQPSPNAQQTKSRPVRTVDVHGLVHAILGYPNADVNVVAIHDGTGARRFTTTNERGEFSLELESGADERAVWWLMALGNETCGTLDQPLVIEPFKPDSSPDDSPTTIDVQITLRLGATISGTIRHSTTGLPIGLAKVYSRQGQLVRTNTAGQFVLHGVPREVEELLVISPGKVRTRVYVDVTERTSAEVDVELQPAGTLKGRVIDRQNMAVGGVSISPYYGWRFLYPPVKETADSEGQYEYEGLPLNRLHFPLRISSRSVEDDNPQMFAIDPKHPIRQMDLRVKPGGHHPPPAAMLVRPLGANAEPPPAAIRGRVIDPAGNSVRTFRVVLLPILHNELRDSGSYSYQVRHFSDDRGQFVIGKLDLDKRYRVSVEADGFGRAIVEPLFARSGGDIERLDEAEFQLTPPHPLQVRVIDAVSKEPLPDVRVGFTDHRQMQDLFEWDYRLQGAFVDWTTDSGRACYLNLAWDQLTIFIEHPGYARQHFVWKDKLDRSQANEPDRVEMALQKESRLRLKVTKFGAHNPLGLHAKIVSRSIDEIYTDLATDVEVPELTMNQLPPGRTQIEIMDARGREPWTVLANLDVELKQGDNTLEIELNDIKK